jgi:Alpha/beta hydrolase family
MSTSTESTGADTIVFIHGLWMTPRSWEQWIERAEGRGYTTIAPAWPGMEVEVEALNADPTPPEKLDVNTFVDHHAVPVEVKEFQGRPHFPAVPGWEEVADYAFDWAAQHAKVPAEFSKAS